MRSGFVSGIITSMRTLPALSLALAVASTATAQDARLSSALHWRNLGPFRAGRVAAVSGAIGVPGTFYIGLPGGGVWKTTSADRHGSPSLTA